MSTHHIPILETPSIIGSNRKSVPDSEQNKKLFGKLNNDSFLKVSQFDVTSLSLAAEELLKRNILWELNEKSNNFNNQDFITDISKNISNDLTVLATPKIPLFNHMTLDSIIGSKDVHRDINKSINQSITQNLSETLNNSNKIIGIDNEIITDLNQTDLSGMEAEILKNLEQPSIADLVDKNINPSNKHYFTAQNMMMEVIKCRMSALYFIENYVSVPVAGGRIPIKESEQWNATDKYKIIIDLFQQHDSVLYMSSRQSGKTTTSAMYLLWCMIFFPKLQVSYLTLDKNRAIDMISRMKEMMDSLPKWLQVKPKSNAERLSYYELSNGSKITASFVSGSNDPDKVGRGLSSPIVFIDETAFINHAEIVWGALQPSVSAAKIFAKKNGYPNGVIFTSTPQGAGSNFFYNVYQNSVKFDDIYDYENKKLHDNYQQEFLKPEKNSFISVVLHWSEFRSQEWYEEQRKELNFNQRKISQELDLSFLGSDASIFSDDVIAQFIPKKRNGRIQLPFGCELDLYDEIDPEEKYYLGVDTAMSAGSGSDYSAMILARASDGKPIGEWHGRFSVVKRFAQVVKACVKSLKILYGLSTDTLNVVIERNSIGKETVEELIYDESNFDYEEFLFYETTEQGEKVPGLYTSNSGKMGQGKRDKMFNALMTYVNEKAYTLSGPMLMDELRNLEQKSSGRIEASKNQHDDIVMAWNFCLFARRYHIENGTLFVKGETKNKAINTEDIINVISTGYGYNNIISAKITDNEINEIINTPEKDKLYKLAGINKIDLKSIEDERRALLKELAKEEANQHDTSYMESLFGTTSNTKINNPNNSIFDEDGNENYNIPTSSNKYEPREEFDINDYFMV